jgi:hypothetical protein
MFLANRIAIGVASCTALIFAAHNFAAAQAAPDEQPSATRGVRHIVYLTVKSDDPDLQKADGAAGQEDEAAKETPKATLKLTLRISDHAQETSFFGDVPITAANFDPVKGSPEQEVWQDERCHHERGFPRVLLMAVDGLIAHGSDKQLVEARPRHIGLPVPWDEIMMASSLQFSADDRGPFIETGTQTKESHLSVVLKIYMLPCQVQ